MCTVTIAPQGEHNFILTSNRDEAPNRLSAAPDFYCFSETELLFPMDELSKGTWIGISEKKRAVCVLNGGFEFHERKGPYRLSRGVVAKEFMSAEDIEVLAASYDLKDIEPFTMVIVAWDNTLKFFELVWDGSSRHFKHLPLEPKIWSSSTLYDAKMQSERLGWFETFKEERALNPKNLLAFHKSAGKGNMDYGVIMDRGFVKTTSITQIEKVDDVVVMHYENLSENLLSSQTFKFPHTVNG